AKISIDKIDMGEVPADGNYSGKLKPGQHYIEAMNGYDHWSQTVTAIPGARLSLTAPLKALPKPILVDLFTANSLNIQQGETVELRWKVQNATEVTIDQGIGLVQTSDSRQVKPLTSTTYTMNAKAEGVPAVSRAISVNVAIPKPAITTFFAGSDKIQPGQSTKLIWTTQNATDVSIDQEVGPVDLSGHHDIRPSKTTAYTLTAKGPGGNATQSVTVAVESVSSSVTPPPPPPPTENPDIKAIKETVKGRYKDAYESMEFDEVKKVWPSLSGSKAEAVRGVFKAKGLKAIKLNLNCGEPMIKGDSAEYRCSEIASYKVGDKRETSKPYPILFQLKKTS